MTESAELTHNQPAFSVSEISGAVKRVMEDSFGHVRVRGEISKVARHSSGHIYFDLKDEKAVLAAVCWKGNAGKVGGLLESGLEVIITGRISTFGGQSKYQLIVEKVEPAGAGALLALLEQRRKKLESEGLFDPARKKPLPYLPTVIGVVTSPTGAVIRDILHRVSDRFPCRVLVWPVRVQGEGAAQEIAAAIEGFDALVPGGPVPRPDVLIVARGGGSVEDLWCFNEEIVVRAVAACSIPLISAVGHETDTTLIDYASDRRAPTPTAAAEMALPLREELQFYFSEAGLRMGRSLLHGLAVRRDWLVGLARGLPRPDDILGQSRQRLDVAGERLANAPRQLLRHKIAELERQTVRLTPLSLRLDQRASGLHSVAGRLTARGLLEQVERRRERVLALGRMLETLDHREVLKRGFALVRDGDGHVVSSRAALPQTPVSLQFHDGSVRVQAIGPDGGRPPATPKKPSKTSGATQGNLF